MEAVAEFAVNLAWVDEMRSSERVAGVQQISLITQVDNVPGNGPILSKTPADREIDGGVRREVGWAVTIHKSGPELIGRRCPDMPRQIESQNPCCRVPLIMIEREGASREEFKQSARDGTDAVGNLI